MSSPNQSGFYGLHVAPKFLDILARLNFTQPTPIQQKAIPLAIDGKDLIGIAQTGTGKTLAFGLPMLQNLSRVKGQGLVVLPTRELAAQVDETLQRLGRGIGVRTAIIVGGASMDRQERMLRNRPHVIVATPGRLIDHLGSKPNLLQQVKILVLDEADRMLDMGFAPQINQILEKVSKERQTMLFSATMPTEIVSIAQKHMALPVRVEIARPGSTTDQVDQEVLFVSKRNKNAQLERLLQRYHGTVLVFSRTKWNAKKLTRDIRQMGHTAAEIHSNRTQAQRREALDGFKRGKYRVLVATDIAARGIDVKNIELVVNYDLPSTPDDYVHRIGRTGRAGKKGKAISFAMPEQQRDVRDIERLIRAELPVGEDSEPVENLGLAKKEFRQQKRHFPRQGGRPQRPHRRSGFRRRR
ncbi:MAG: DEAD/DEAH box helicase [Candidatus Nomurabacteria bacterium]|nr:MAG: DEAD/DEAH box helicase [Candidatus Nomurabacteria bacterium]